MIVWAGLNFLILLGALLPYSRCAHYLVRGWEFPRVQLFVLALASILTQTITVGWEGPWLMLGSMAIGAALIQLIWIIPFTPIFPKEVEATSKRLPEKALRIIAANVLQSNRRAPDLLALVRRYKPDFLVVLEVNQWWCDQLESLREDGFVHTLKCPLDNLYGMAVFSRLELRDGKIEFLIDDAVPSIHGAVILRSGDAVACHWLHPAPPSPTENEESTDRDAELVIVGRRVAAESRRPTVVAGDLNDVAWSATTRLFRKISGLLDPRVGRGLFNSYHAKYPGLRWPLDHVFHSEEFTLNEIKCLPEFGSDHFPLLIEVQLCEGANDEEAGISPTSGTRQWAEKKIAEADSDAADR